MRIVSAAEMRALDARTIADGTPGRVLMERAGRAAAVAARGLLRGRRGAVVVACGRGNNGGDGFVVARLLRGRGHRVETWLLGAVTDVRGDAAGMLARWRRGGGRVRLLASGNDVEAFAARCRGAALVVDALFGTGLNAPVVGLAAEVVQAINRAGAPTLALDVPSGLSADTGRALGVAVRAAATVTFGLAKIGLCVAPGSEYAGRLQIADIGLSASSGTDGTPPVELLEAPLVGALLPPRPRLAHKGTFGHALVVAGSRGKLGAGLLAAEGAARAGAGLTTLAVPASLQPQAEGRVPEVMTAGVADDGSGTMAAPDDAEMARLIRGRAAVVCGPGLGEGAGPRAVVGALLDAVAVPLVLDADGLNAVAGTPLLQGRTAPTVLTPHPGEMARLVGATTDDVQADRLGVARSFAAANGVVVVLKGAGTIIAAPDGRCALSSSGNPGLASGGSGDVLAGVIGGLLAQGLPPFEAATFAVFVHGRAADAIASRRGEVGLLARDLLAELPLAIAALQREALA
jgi:NAD(P)H-hydrate epimerase